MRDIHDEEDEPEGFHFRDDRDSQRFVLLLGDPERRRQGDVLVRMERSGLETPGSISRNDSSCSNSSLSSMSSRSDWSTCSVNAPPQRPTMPEDDVTTGAKNRVPAKHSKSKFRRARDVRNTASGTSELHHPQPLRPLQNTQLALAPVIQKQRQTPIAPLAPSPQVNHLRISLDIPPPVPTNTRKRSLSTLPPLTTTDDGKRPRIELESAHSDARPGKNDMVADSMKEGEQGFEPVLASDKVRLSSLAQSKLATKFSTHRIASPTIAPASMLPVPPTPETDFSISPIVPSTRSTQTIASATPALSNIISPPLLKSNLESPIEAIILPTPFRSPVSTPSPATSPIGSPIQDFLLPSPRSPFGPRGPETKAAHVPDRHPRWEKNMSNAHDRRPHLPVQPELWETMVLEANHRGSLEDEYEAIEEDDETDEEFNAEEEEEREEFEVVQQEKEGSEDNRQEEEFEVDQQEEDLDSYQWGDLKEEEFNTLEDSDADNQENDECNADTNHMVEESKGSQQEKESDAFVDEDEEEEEGNGGFNFNVKEKKKSEGNPWEDSERDRQAAREAQSRQEPIANPLQGIAQVEQLLGQLQQEFFFKPAQSPEDETGTGDKIIDWLQSLFRDKERYQKFLRLEESRAQPVVNLLQAMLDSCDIPELDFRKDVVITLQRFAKRSEVYPTSYQVRENIVLEQEHYTGSGGFGDIYKYQLGPRKVCVKAIRMSQVSKGRRFMKQFMKEAILWAQLSHQNIVPFQGFFYWSNRPCLLSPWMSNGHISEYLQKHPDSNRYLLIRDMTEGLHYLHSWGIVHGDLKGPNVMVDDSGHACLTDFGISSIFDTALPHWTSQSAIASKGGSIRWQAPELFNSTASDDKDVHNTIMSDIYAWGCTCYEVFTGKLPFYEYARDATVIVQMIRDRKRPSRPLGDDPSWLRWGLQEPFWNLIESCWVDEPAKRPSVDNLLSAPLLVKALDDRPVNAELELSSRYRTTRGAKINFPTTKELERLVSSIPSINCID